MTALIAIPFALYSGQAQAADYTDSGQTVFSVDPLVYDIITGHDNTIQSDVNIAFTGVTGKGNVLIAPIVLFTGSELNDTTIYGQLEGFGIIEVTRSTLEGLTGADLGDSMAFLVDTSVQGDISNLGVLAVEGGSVVTGNVGADGAKVFQVSITDSSVTGDVWAETLLMFGGTLSGARTIDEQLGTVNADAITLTDATVRTRMLTSSGTVSFTNSNITVAGGIRATTPGVLQVAEIASKSSSITADVIRVTSTSGLVTRVEFDDSSVNVAEDFTLSAETGSLLVFSNTSTVDIGGALTANVETSVTNQSYLFAETLSTVGLNVVQNSTLTLTKPADGNPIVANLNGGSLLVQSSIVSVTTPDLTRVVIGVIDQIDGAQLQGADISAALRMKGDLTMYDSVLTAVTQDIEPLGDVLMNRSQIAHVYDDTVMSSLDMTDSDIFTGATSVTGDIAMKEGSAIRTATFATGADGSVTSSLGTVTGEGDISMDGASQIIANVSTDGSVTLKADSVIDARETVTAADGSVTSTTLGTLDAAEVTMHDNSVIHATVTGEHVTMYEGSRVSGQIDADTLTTSGDVYTADVNVNSLSVNHGVLDATGHDVIVKENTILNHGTVIADRFEGGSITLTDVSGTLGSIESAAGFVHTGETLLVVDGAANVGTDLTVSEGATLRVDGEGITAGDNVVDVGKNLLVTDNSHLIVNNGPAVVGGNITVESSTLDVGAGVTMDGNILTLNDAEIKADVLGAEKTQVGAASTITSLTTEGLDIQAGASLNAQNDVTGNGQLNILGELSSAKGALSLTGETGSTIDADVTSHQSSVTLAGSIKTASTAGQASNSVISAAQDLIIAQDAEISSADTTYAAGDSLTVLGTLNADENVQLLAGVTGTGTINKSGGDTLLLSDVQLQGGALHIKDASAADVTAGGHVGSLTVEGDSSIIVAGHAAGSGSYDATLLGSIGANDLTLGTSTGKATVALDLDVAQLAASPTTGYDQILADGALTIVDAKLQVTAHNIGSEGLINKDTLVAGVIDAASLTSGAIDERIDHTFDTLNAHAITNADGSVDILLSQNYKGVDGNANQTGVSGGLQDVNPNAVAGSVLGNILTALGETRSEAAALAALDSLGGRGLAGVNKIVIEDAYNHLQILRASQRSLNAGLTLGYDPSTGAPVRDGQSHAIALEYTGSHAEITDDGNGSYSSSSYGFMLIGAVKVTDKWTLGYDFAYSYADADAAEVSMNSSGFFMDVTATHTSKRLTQYFSLGASLFSINTDRDLYVNAPGYSVSGQAKGSTTAALLNISYEAAYDLTPRERQHQFAAIAVVDASFGSIDEITEKGSADNAGLYANYDDIVNITVGAGVRYSYIFQFMGRQAAVSAESLFTVNAGNTDLSVTNRFIGGGSAFNQYGPEASRGGLRLNATGYLPVADQWSVFGQVTGNFNPDETSCNGSVGVKYSF